MNKNSSSLKKVKSFKSKFYLGFKYNNKFYHFILTSSIKDIEEFRRVFTNFLKELSRKKVSWKRVRVIEVQIRDCWHLHIAGTYLAMNLHSLWCHGFVKVRRWEDKEALVNYLSKSFSSTSQLLPSNSRMLYRFDFFRVNLKKNLQIETFSMWKSFWNWLFSLLSFLSLKSGF